MVVLELVQKKSCLCSQFFKFIIAQMGPSIVEAVDDLRTIQQSLWEVSPADTACLIVSFFPAQREAILNKIFSIVGLIQNFIANND